MARSDGIPVGCPPDRVSRTEEEAERAQRNTSSLGVKMRTLAKPQLDELNCHQSADVWVTADGYESPCVWGSNWGRPSLTWWLRTHHPLSLNFCSVPGPCGPWARVHDVRQRKAQDRNPAHLPDFRAPTFLKQNSINSTLNPSYGHNSAKSWEIQWKQCASPA